MKLFSRLIVSLVLFVSLCIPSLVVQAASLTGGSTVSLTNPIQPPKTKDDPTACQGGTNVKCIIGNALTVVLGIMGSITLGAFVFGGYMWLTSAGNDEKVRTGTSTLMYATIGLFIIFGAYAILNTILKGVAK